MNRPSAAISRLEVLPIRQAFPHEAHDFTAWLEDHVDILSERLGLQLSVVRREERIGDFIVDLLCQDERGDRVVIEDQLERTDHSHLGQILTYLTMLEAKKAIWITTEARVEHQRVVEWLNETMPADFAFFLVKVEATRIADSPIGVLFSILAAPDAEAKAVGREKKELAAQDQRLFEFWSKLLETCRTRTRLFDNVSPGYRHYIGAGAGISGVSFNLVARQDSSSVELYIDADKDTGSGNKAIFDAIAKNRDVVESAVGSPLEWDRLDGKRASRIRKNFNEGGFMVPETWGRLHTLMAESVARLAGALEPILGNIKRAGRE